MFFRGFVSVFGMTTANKKFEFNFEWKIEKFPFFEKRRDYALCSPKFTVDFLSGTEWRLVLFPRGHGTRSRTSVYIERCKNQGGPNEIKAYFSFAFMSSKGEHFEKKSLDEKWFTAPKAWGYRYFIKTSALFGDRKSDLIPEDTLTISCLLWQGSGNLCLKDKSTATTVINVTKYSIFASVKDFSKLKSGAWRALSFSQHNCLTLDNSGQLDSESESDSSESESDSSGGEPDSVLVTQNNSRISTDRNIKKCYLHLENCSENETLLNIELIPFAGIGESIVSCEFFIMDFSSKKVAKCAQVDNVINFFNDEKWFVPLSLTREDLMSENRLFLPNDVLFLQCDITVSTGTISTSFCTDILPVNCASTSSDSCVLKNEELWNLRKDDILCDKKLKTRTSSFPVHMAVLAAASDVFRAMFTSDMKEKTDEFVNVPDMDDDTVSRLLLFIYKGTLQNLDWESALKLYSAAGKYLIVELQKRCKDFLRENVSIQNVCNLLISSYLHNDQDFKHYLLKFLILHKHTVIESDEWKVLENDYPKLAIEMLRII